MSRIMGWLKNVPGKIFDPHRAARIKHAAATVEQRILEQRREFKFDEAVHDLDVFTEDLPLIVAAVYELFAARAWRDGSISEKERTSLDWVGGKLGLSIADARAIEQSLGIERFGKLLADSLADGQLDQSELDQLRRLATSLHTDIKSMLHSRFRDEAEGVLRTLFMRAAADGGITTDEWNRLCHAVVQLGLSRSDLLDATRQPARRLIEHALAEAKADGIISPEEDARISWLIDNLIDDPAFRSYVRAEIQRIQMIGRINSGHLPSLACRDALLRAGELVHWIGQATYYRTRQLQSGPSPSPHQGNLIITDCRSLFISPALGLDLNHRRIMNLIPMQGGFELQSAGKGNGIWALANDAEIGTAIYWTAIRRANQTVVASDDSQARRRIPRDVRQRVWQKYGGRCADCGADSYLEYDHIIPVAKGGGNSDQNVQLLCRSCNGKKSDAI